MQISSNKGLLRVSAFKKANDANRTTLWKNTMVSQHIVFLTGVIGGYFLPDEILTGVTGWASVNYPTNPFVNKTVELITNHSEYVAYIPLACAVFGGLTVMFYLYRQDNKIINNEKNVEKILGNNGRQCIDEGVARKLKKLVSESVWKDPAIAETSILSQTDAQDTMKQEQNLFRTFLNQILLKRNRISEIYKDIQAKFTGGKEAIDEILCSFVTPNLAIKDVQSIFDFAYECDLHRLKDECIKCAKSIAKMAKSNSEKS